MPVNGEQPAPRPTVADDIQTVEGPQQSLRAGHQLDFLVLVRLLLIDELDIEQFDLRV